jgi:hypothetical protein
MACLGPCQCLNCPQKPVFQSHEEFVIHWNATHTVSPTTTIELPESLKAFFPEVTAKSVELHKDLGAKTA